MPEPIKVLIAEDNQMVRRGLRLVVDSADDMTLVGTASNGFEAIIVYSLTNPHVILMDLAMPKMNGINAMRTIRQFDNDVGIVVMAGYNDKETLETVMAMGASHYLMKDVSADEVLMAIRSAYQPDD